MATRKSKQPKPLPGPRRKREGLSLPLSPEMSTAVKLLAKYAGTSQSAVLRDLGQLLAGELRVTLHAMSARYEADRRENLRLAFEAPVQASPRAAQAFGEGFEAAARDETSVPGDEGVPSTDTIFLPPYDPERA